MARDISRRLRQLTSRRSGTDRLAALNSAQQVEAFTKSFTQDSWQKRATDNQSYTRYALGAMQEVSADYTRISLETAERVGRQLKSELAAAGFGVDFRLQGSVPLNVHIRGVSDVDLLTLDTSFFTYATYGRYAQAGMYKNPSTKTSIGVLSELRRAAEKILILKYPAAIVDTTGGKAINISGGSLPRPVDVVPSHWNDTINYQNSGQEYDRGVTILNKKKPETIDNLPFLHIKTIHDRDSVVIGSLKKAIRLCKNVKSDAENENNLIALPSYDIAAIMYHANHDALKLGSIYELAILAETQRHLDYLYMNKEFSRTLIVPDGSRRIFDSESKFSALLKLSIEINDLAKEVAKEQNPRLSIYETPAWTDTRTSLNSAYVPFVT